LREQRNDVRHNEPPQDVRRGSLVDALADLIRERPARFVQVRKALEETTLVLARSLVPSHRLPSYEGAVGVGELPAVPATPVPNRIAVA